VKTVNTVTTLRVEHAISDLDTARCVRSILRCVGKMPASSQIGSTNQPMTIIA